ncbi:MAG TPA: AlkA N-terminal domain-containing protein, partial [Thermomicrobiaceae bacterium]|nr:AlkA N-terminal domain-containing protein [Thermomicrobiaceae bacterium]
LAFLAAQATPGVEDVGPHGYRRTVRVGGHTGILSARPLPARRVLLLRLPSALAPRLLSITERVKRLFDLKADPAAIAEALAVDPELAPAVGAQPGMRLPGCWDGFEVAVQAVLEASRPGRGREMAGALVARFGTALPDQPEPRLTHLFPEPGRLRDARLEEAGIDAPLAGTLRALARAVDDGRLPLDDGADLTDLTVGLATIAGLDAAVIPYIAARVLGEPDLDLGGTLLPGEYGRRRGSTERTDAGGWLCYAALYRWADARACAHAATVRQPA